MTGVQFEKSGARFAAADFWSQRQSTRIPFPNPIVLFKPLCLAKKFDYWAVRAGPNDTPLTSPPRLLNLPSPFSTHLMIVVGQVKC